MEDIMNIDNMTSAELDKAIITLKAYRDYGVPDDFDDYNTHLMHNEDSGEVFITNDDYQVAMYNNYTGKLESWYFTPCDGHEGFIEDLVSYLRDEDYFMEIEDVEYIKEICEFYHRDEDVEFLENYIKEESEKVKKYLKKMIEREINN